MRREEGFRSGVSAMLLLDSRFGLDGGGAARDLTGSTGEFLPVAAFTRSLRGRP
jgi:hypothetical protein